MNTDEAAVRGPQSVVPSVPLRSPIFDLPSPLSNLLPPRRPRSPANPEGVAASADGASPIPKTLRLSRERELGPAGGVMKPLQGWGIVRDASPRVARSAQPLGWVIASFQDEGGMLR